jgi:hypothetical protein
MESRGTVPVKFWFESSIYVTKLSELQVMSVKLHELEEDSHELKTSVVEPLSAYSSFERIWSSSDFTLERRARKQQRR